MQCHDLRYSILAIIVLITSSCQRVERPLPLPEAKKLVAQYYESGSYEKDLDHLISRAKKHFAKIPVTDHSIVIFDIDDTSLSTYSPYKQADFCYKKNLLHQEIMKSNLPAIPHIKDLYDYLRHRGFLIVFLTGRTKDEAEATKKNLMDQGFTQFEKIIFRSLNKRASSSRYKERSRESLAQEGYTIVGTVGDQYSDMAGKFTGYRVKLPNYMYYIA